MSETTTIQGFRARTGPLSFCELDAHVSPTRHTKFHTFSESSARKAHQNPPIEFALPKVWRNISSRNINACPALDSAFFADLRTTMQSEISALIRRRPTLIDRVLARTDTIKTDRRCRSENLAFSARQLARCRHPHRSRSGTRVGSQVPRPSISRVIKILCRRPVELWFSISGSSVVRSCVRTTSPIRGWLVAHEKESVVGRPPPQIQQQQQQR